MVMDFKQLYNQLNEAVSLDKPERAFNSVREHVKSHCLFPKTLVVIDSLTGCQRTIQVPCGKCSHCQSQKVSEWVTRLYAHLEGYKFCYFVTLTYRSFTRHDIELNNKPYRICMEYLKHALWHEDSFNTTNKLAFSPCCLVKRHYQLFLKRLRNSLKNNDLSYVISGEYGDEFARPHFHLLLFSNEPITLSMCRRAWSLQYTYKTDSYGRSFCVPYVGKKTKNINVYRIVFGNVDFADLVSNGTITNESIKLDGVNRSCRSCFAYVCKYVNKSGLLPYSQYKFESNNLLGVRTFNDARLLYAHDSLKFLYHLYESPIPSDDLNKPYNLFSNLFVNYYDLFTLDDFGQKSSSFSEDYESFVNEYKPFKECSRSTAIGSLYASSNIEKFSRGVFPPPPLQTQGFIVPSYFRRKAKEYLFSLQRKSPFSSSSSFSSGNVASFFADFNNLGEDGFSVRYGLDLSLFHDFGELLNSRFAFRDCFTGERFLIVRDPLCDVFVPCFKYDRSKRSYVQIKQYTLTEFLDLYFVKYLTALQSHSVRLDAFYEQEKYKQLCDISLNLFGESFENLSKKFAYDIQRELDACYFSNKIKLKNKNVL